MLGQPSVIARLMGLEDTIVPAAPTPAIPAAAEEDTLLKPPSKLKQFKCSSLPHHGDYYRYCLNKMKPRRKSSSRGHSRRDHDRHHPKEELLEKIKEEFRASWQQASMASASASGRSSSGERAGWVDGRYIQRVAQENLRREKMARHGYGANGKTKVVGDEEEGIKAAVVVSMNKAEEAERQQQKQVGSECAEAKVAESEEFFRDSGAAVNGEHDENDDRTSNTSGNSRGTPTRIAILRPIGTTHAAGDHREPEFGMPPTSWKATRDGGMEEFLRAVKERLNNEMKAKTGPGDVLAPTTRRRRGWGSEEAKGDTARQIREAMVTKEDLGRRLSRLESFRVFRGDRGRRDAAAVKSPEHRMLKRVRARIEAMSPKKTRLSGCSSPVSSRGGRVWSSPPADAGHASSLSGIGSDDDEEVQGAAHTAGTEADAVASPWPSLRALVRSFSAPASWRVSDGGSETTCGEGAEVKLSRSRSFSLLRGTVSGGLKQSFSLLLTHLTKKSPSSPRDSGDLITAAQADFLAGLAPPSPVSPLEVHGRNFPGCTFLPESSPRRSPKCSSEYGASVVGGESPWRWRTDAAAESDEDPDKAYVRGLIIATGLLDDNEDGGGGSSEDTAVGSTDSMAGPVVISDDVFYEVEDAYYYRRVDEDAGPGEEYHGDRADRRRLLFDLANEALQAQQAAPSSLHSFPQWLVDNGVLSSSSLRLRGSDLEDEVWRRVARAMTGDGDGPAPATTVDSMVEREVGRSPWMALREDVRAVGRKVERAIFDELVGEVVRQVFVRT